MDGIWLFISCFVDLILIVLSFPFHYHWFTLGPSYALFSYFMGFCDPFLKLGLLSMSDCKSDLYLQHKREEKIRMFSRPIANLCDLLKLAKYLFENSAQTFSLIAMASSNPRVGRRNPLCRYKSTGHSPLQTTENLLHCRLVNRKLAYPYVCNLSVKCTNIDLIFNFTFTLTFTFTFNALA